MSIDKSLRRKNSLARARSVLTRDERIKTLIETERWTEGQSPFNLPKVRVFKLVKKGAKKEKAEGDAAAAPAGKGAAPAAKGAAPAKGAPAAKAAAPAAKAAAPAAKKK